MKFPHNYKIYAAFAAILIGIASSVFAADEYMVIDVSGGFSASSYPVALYDTADLPGTVTDDTYKTTHVLLKKIEAGTFMMGSPTNEVGRPSFNPDEDLHQVTLTQDYYIGVFEITQYQFGKLSGIPDIDKAPVYGKNYNDNVFPQFIDPLDNKADLNGWFVTLPTEAQWEYACRAGTQTSYSFGSDTAQLENYAWYDANSSTFPVFSSEVGTRLPNPWGLYDMHGSVMEFCRDAYNANLGSAPLTDPFYSSGTGFRVAKGGDAWSDPAACRSAARVSIAAGGTHTGFRICVEIPPPPPTYELTVFNGTGDGTYTNAHVQQIIADAAPPWFEFDQWTGTVANVADVSASTTTITIAGTDVSVGASYTNQIFDITVSNGTASAYTATNAQLVTVYADPPATETNIFWRWEGDVAGLADMNAMTTTLTVAGADVDLVAVYRDAPYTLTVVGGSGGGGYHFEGEIVAVQAPAPGEHKLFLWEGSATFADQEAWNTTLVMPGADTVVTATYPDKEYTLIVVNGTGSGRYTNGAAVAVNTSYLPSDFHQFERWDGDSVNLDNPLQPSATYTVDGADRVIYPVYEPLTAVRGEYMVLNLVYSGSQIEVTYMDEPPAGGWDYTYRDTKMAFRRIMPGTYQMGTGDVPYEDEHTVTLTDAFYMGIFEVTQGQWDTVLGGYPSNYSGSGRDRHPVENISYDDIRGGVNGSDWPDDEDVDDPSFVGVIRNKTGSDGFDLPTEAQWEYACRAGTSGGWCVDDSDVFDVAVVSVFGQPELENTAEVATLAPNNWGLYDTHGNVYEWCLDWYYGTGLGTAPQTDPLGPTSPDESYRRIIRGGSYELIASPWSKAGYRAGQITNGDSHHTGFRMIRWIGTPHSLTVVDGKVNTAGVFYYRAKIGISAADKPGQTFDYWRVEPEGAFAGALFEAKERDTVVTMPGQDITITAQYR